ncbi:MAG: hypothetical protein EPO24_03965 [Bacteroidetes bacterium]|nr:MAG: hypothetical protein EPO24_03965 [Bacteroidota bacterium]
MNKVKSHSSSGKGVRSALVEYWLSAWRPYLVIMLLGLLAFGSTLWFSFIQFDDNILIQEKYHIIGSLSQIIPSFKTPYLEYYYRPVVMLSLILDAQISGQEPWMYHLSNVLYHLAASCLVFLLLLKLKSSRGVALFSSALFAVHPMATHAVAWILGRNDSLLAIAVLLSFVAMINFETTKRWYFFVLHVLSFFIALLVKETAIVFPLLGLYYLSFIARKQLLSKETVRYVLAWLSVIFVWYFIRMPVLEGVPNTFSFNSFILNLRVVLEMLGKMVIPIRLSGYPTFDTIPLITGSVVVVLVALFLISNQAIRSRNNICSLVWFVVFILPGLGIHLTDSIHKYDYLECRAYSSLVGVSLLVAGILSSNFTTLPRWTKRAGFFVIPLFAVISVSYSMNYKDALSHWRHAVAMSPQSANVHYKLGIVWSQVEHNPTEAVRCFEKAIELDSTNFEYHDNVGIEYGTLGLLEKAEIEFKKAIALNPSHPFPQSNLGYLYFLQGNNALAEQYLKEAFRLDSNFSKSQELLVHVYYRERNYEKMLYFAERVQHAGVMLDSNMKRVVDSLQNK